MRTRGALARLLPGGGDAAAAQPGAPVSARLRRGPDDARAAGAARAASCRRRLAGAAVERQPWPAAPDPRAARRRAGADPRGGRPGDRRRRAARDAVDGRRPAPVRGRRHRRRVDRRAPGRVSARRRSRPRSAASSTSTRPPTWSMIRADMPALRRVPGRCSWRPAAPAPRAILELGTGTGETARRLLARHPDAVAGRDRRERVDARGARASGCRRSASGSRCGRAAAGSASRRAVRPGRQRAVRPPSRRAGEGAICSRACATCSSPAAGSCSPTWSCRVEPGAATTSLTPGLRQARARSPTSSVAGGGRASTRASSWQHATTWR